MNEEAIGFFDSGVGGLSVWREVVELLPDENTIYLADSAHAPYGKKSRKEILFLSQKNTERLLEKNAKLIVVACNTATTAAIQHLRARYKVPFVGIEPAIKSAALQTQSCKIAVLATRGTLDSTLFAETAQRFSQSAAVFIREGKGLVEQVEKNALHTAETQALLHAQLKSLAKQPIDALVLGCTHYPFLKEEIEKILGPEMKILDAGKPVAQQVRRILVQEKRLNTASKRAEHSIFTNGDIRVIARLIQGFRPLQTQIEYSDF